MVGAVREPPLRGWMPRPPRRESLRGNYRGARIKYGAGFGRPHKGKETTAGFLTVNPAKAGIQGARDEDGFRLSPE